MKLRNNLHTFFLKSKIEIEIHDITEITTDNTDYTTTDNIVKMKHINTEVHQAHDK